MSEDPEDLTVLHQLRPVIPHQPPLSLPPTLVPTVSSNDKALLDMKSLALSLAHVAFPLHKLQKSLGCAMATRMRARAGKYIWQTVQGCVENFPLEAATQILPEQLMSGQGSTASWTATSVLEVVVLARPLIELSASFSAGCSRAVFSPSERVVRVVATIIPNLTLRWVSDTVRYDFQDVLADEDGELHSPKDANRNEIELTEELEGAVRQQVLADIAQMADAGVPLAPGFLRQLGRQDEAAVVEAKLHNVQPVPEVALHGAPSLDHLPHQEEKKQRRKSASYFKIDHIVEAKAATRLTEATFLVQWEGYHPSWEAWRISGEVGSPILTWEPWSSVRRTKALEAWQAQLE